jgi:hypothetical protein
MDSRNRKRDAVAKFYDICPHPSCTKRGDFCRGMCSSHYLIFRRDCQANGSWGSGDPLPSPIVIKHWEWMGSEDELAAMVEQQERLRSLKAAQKELKEEKYDNE